MAHLYKKIISVDKVVTGMEFVMNSQLTGKKAR
jgi:hypothetical protein